MVKQRDILDASVASTWLLTGLSSGLDLEFSPVQKLDEMEISGAATVALLSIGENSMLFCLCLAPHTLLLHK